MRAHPSSELHPVPFDPEFIHAVLAAVIGAITAITLAFFVKRYLLAMDSDEEPESPSTRSLSSASETIAKHRAQLRFSDALAVARELVQTHPNNLRARVLFVEQLVSVGEIKRAHLEIERLAADRPGRHVDELRSLLSTSLQ
jgi:hypothetical protein